MKKSMILFAMGSLLVAAGVAAHDGHNHSKAVTPATPAKAAAPAKGVVAPEMRTRTLTLVGELVDPQCWFTHDGQGPEHKDCAVMCAKGGQDLALYETGTGRLYPIISSAHGASPNEGLIEHVAVPVRVTGTVYSRGQNHALQVDKVQKIAAKR